jgi:hypothetical protein
MKIHAAGGILAALLLTAISGAALAQGSFDPYKLAPPDFVAPEDGTEPPVLAQPGVRNPVAINPNKPIFAVKGAVLCPLSAIYEATGGDAAIGTNDVNQFSRGLSMLDAGASTCIRMTRRQRVHIMIDGGSSGVTLIRQQGSPENFVTWRTNLTN